MIKKEKATIFFSSLKEKRKRGKKLGIYEFLQNP